MKKRLMNLIAIVAALGMVFMAGPVMAAETEGSDVDGNIGGTIPTIRSFDSVVAGGTMNNTFFTALTDSDYNTGSITSDLAEGTITVTANTAWEVTVEAGLDGNYFTTSPAGYTRAVNQKPLSDLLIKIANFNKGTDTAAALPAVENSFDSLKVLTYAAQDMVNCASGNDSAYWNIQYQMLLDAAEDTPGAYSCNILYTIQADD